MRQDFVYHLPISIAQRVSNRKRKRSFLTGAMVVALAFRCWTVLLVILILLTALNFFQNRR